MANQKQNKNDGMWGVVRIVSMIVMVIGVVVILYSGYRLFTFHSGFSGVTTQGPYIRGNYNQSEYNQSGFNQSSIATNRGGAFGSGLFASPDAIVIGILMILLGFVSLKYAQLRIGK